MGGPLTRYSYSLCLQGLLCLEGNLFQSLWNVDQKYMTRASNFPRNSEAQLPESECSIGPIGSSQ